MFFNNTEDNSPEEIKVIEKTIQESVNENLNVFASIRSEVTVSHAEPRETAFRTYRSEVKKTLTITVEVDISDTTLTFKSNE